MINATRAVQTRKFHFVQQRSPSNQSATNFLKVICTQKIMICQWWSPVSERIMRWPRPWLSSDELVFAFPHTANCIMYVSIHSCSVCEYKGPFKMYILLSGSLQTNSAQTWYTCTAFWTAALQRRHRGKLLPSEMTKSVIAQGLVQM